VAHLAHTSLPYLTGPQGTRARRVTWAGDVRGPSRRRCPGRAPPLVLLYRASMRRNAPRRRGAGVLPTSSSRSLAILQKTVSNPYVTLATVHVIASSFPTRRLDDAEGGCLTPLPQQQRQRHPPSEEARSAQRREL
jgi:hypothetical protein